MSISRCHHGTIIHHSWQECDQCWAERDAMDVADAARETAETSSAALEEKRKQTALMEQILKNQQEILKKKS